MDTKALKSELDSAYKKLEKADNQIENLLKERRQTKMVLEMLTTAGFITEGKLEEAREFVQTFYG
jgi:hypothetical protein